MNMNLWYNNVYLVIHVFMEQEKNSHMINNRLS